MRIGTRMLAYCMPAALLVLSAACGSGSNTSSSSGSSAPAATQAAATQAASGAAAATAPPFACVSGTITAAGSTAIQPLADAAAKMYTSKCSGANVTVQGGGSGTGLSQVSQGAVQIGDSDIKAEDNGITGLVNHIVAKQGFAVVTSKDITVSNLTQKQATDIFTCKVTNWKDVGGADKPITVVLRPQSSGTRATFKNLVLQGAQECQTATTLTQDSSGAVRQAVEQSPGSISVIGFAYFADPTTKGALNIVKFDGVEPTVANIGNGSYKISSDANMYTKGEASGLTKAFLDYLLSDDVQKQLIPSQNFGPVR